MSIKQCGAALAAAGLLATLVGAFIAGAPVSAGAQGQADSRLKPYDDLLDLYVRDGLVYYRALKSERARLDGFVNALADERIDGGSREQQMAFWINAYNAFVLKTVIDHYPIVQVTRQYPARSIRQIPGAFERLQHRAAGRTVTLDQIEQTILPAFHDPRVFLALGRGAMGSSRLRSEAYRAERLEQQLAEQASECLNHAQCVSVDIAANRLRASSVFSWREQDFVDAYADKDPPPFTERSPIEKAVLAFIDPRLLKSERDFLEKNTFRLEYIPFDWSLNDLTGR